MLSNLIIPLMIILAPFHFFAEANYGTFIGTVTAEWKEARPMQLTEDFAYQDPNGKIWGVPKGAVIDGASIPKPLWSILGGPFEGYYRNASVVHDYYCEIKKEKWQDVHRMFYLGMRAGGVGEKKAKVMYAAVYLFGPRWKNVQVQRTNKIKNRSDRIVILEDYTMESEWKQEFDQKEWSSIQNWVETDNPDLEQIDSRGDKLKLKNNEPPSKITYNK